MNRYELSNAVLLGDRRRSRRAHPEEGCTRCYCGSKYWENDTCISCGEKWDKTEEKP